MRIVLTTNPVPLVTLDEAREQLRVDDSASDGQITRWLATATRQAENYCDRQLSAGTYVATFDTQPCGPWIKIPFSPITAVTEVGYVGSDGISQVWAPESYTVAILRNSFEIRLAFGVVWPTAPTGLAVTFIADAPPEAKDAVLLLAGNLNENRENQVVESGIAVVNTRAAESLLDPYRVWSL